MKRKRKTPCQQLRGMLQTVEQRFVLSQMLSVMNRRSQDDFCLGCIAYIRYGLRRKFQNRILETMFIIYCEDLLDK